MLPIHLLAGLLTLASAESAPPSSSPAPATAPAPKAEILGLWKGSSTCTKVEAAKFCHDETVVYNVVDVPDQPSTVLMKAARVVDGAVQQMYELYFSYRPGEGRWACEFERPNFRGVWSYAIHGDEMTGTATTLPDQTVVRNVSVKRATKDQVLSR